MSGKDDWIFFNSFILVFLYEKCKVIYLPLKISQQLVRSLIISQLTLKLIVYVNLDFR